MTNHSYDEIFFDYVSAGAIRSARSFLPVILDALHPNSVLDVGCGRGAWLSVWQELGIKKICGIDGDYVSKKKLLIPDHHFLAHNLIQPFDLSQNFDLVQCLEVAEHLPESSAKTFIASLVNHSKIVLFSAAPKGQGGDQHINEQNYEYWRKIFSEHSYMPIDFIRPIIKNNKEIEPWYRYNSILYVSSTTIERLPIHIQHFLVTENKPIKDVSPLVYKLRKFIIKHLPAATMTQLAKIKERSFARKTQARNKQWAD